MIPNPTTLLTEFVDVDLVHLVSYNVLFWGVLAGESFLEPIDKAALATDIDTVVVSFLPCYNLINDCRGYEGLVDFQPSFVSIYSIVSKNVIEWQGPV